MPILTLLKKPERAFKALLQGWFVLLLTGVERDLSQSKKVRYKLNMEKEKSNER